MKPHAHFPALPIEGNAKSAVVVETWEDLACKDAAHWRQQMESSLLPKYADRVAFSPHDFPLEKHPWAEDAAVASRAFSAREAAAGIAFRRYCLENLADISVENLPERIADFALLQRLDPEEAELSLRSEDLRNAVRADAEAGRTRGVQKTPTVFVGSVEFVESFPVKALEDAIEAALKRL